MRSSKDSSNKPIKTQFSTSQTKIVNSYDTNCNPLKHQHNTPYVGVEKDYSKNPQGSTIEYKRVQFLQDH